MENKEYFEVSVNINPNAIELVTDVFFERFECEGVVQAEEKYKDLELVETTNNIAKGYILFEEEKFAPLDIQKTFYDAKEDLLSKGFSDEELGDWSISAKKVINEDWSRKWKEHWKPTRASKHVVICPSWEEYAVKKDEILISLDPGSAFGTGTHATTQLCIQAIEKYMPADSQVGDIGSGSGILAIAAVKCGACYAVGIDNDPLVIDVARDNAHVNRVLDKMDFSCKTADELLKTHREGFDFICANILHNVLAEIMSDLKGLMKPSSHMVLSGILNEKQQVVLDAVKEQSLEVVEILNQDNWVAIVVKKGA